MFGGMSGLAGMPEAPASLTPSQEMIQRIIGQLDMLEVKLDPVLGGPRSAQVSEVEKPAATPSQLITGLSTINGRIAAILDRINV